MGNLLSTPKFEKSYSRTFADSIGRLLRLGQRSGEIKLKTERIALVTLLSRFIGVAVLPVQAQSSTIESTDSAIPREDLQTIQIIDRNHGRFIYKIQRLATKSASVFPQPRSRRKLLELVRRFQSRLESSKSIRRMLNGNEQVIAYPGDTLRQGMMLKPIDAEGSFSCLWECEEEGAPLTRLRLHPDFPAVALDHFFANRQSGAGPLKILLTMEPFKELKDLLRIT